MFSAATSDSGDLDSMLDEDACPVNDLQDPSPTPLVTREELNSTFQELVEAELLDNFDLVQAERATSTGALPALHARSELQDWKTIKETMKALAFNLSAADPWQLLGVTKYEGPSPTIDLIERRAHLASLFASVRYNTTLPSSDFQELETLERIAEEARQRCMAELPQILRQRKKTQKKLILRWLETSPDFLNYIHARNVAEPQPLQVALSLSNLQDLPPHDYEHAVQIPKAREWYSDLYLGGDRTETVLRNFQGSGIIMWAPSENDVLNKLTAAFQKYVLSPGAQCTLKLLVSYEPLPGCISAEQILDLWWCPLLSDKWKSLLRNIEFFRQPTRCVFTGQLGPMHHIKSLALFTLSAEPLPLHSSVTSWRPNLIEEANCPAIVLDCDAQDQLMIHKALLGAELPGLLRWDGPRRSLGTTASQKRICFTGFFDPSIVSELDIRLYIMILRSREALNLSFIGNRALYANQASMLVEFRLPLTCMKCRDLCEEIVLVSPKLAAIMTSKPAAEWASRLTKIAKEDPSAMIDKVRFRTSRHGGRPWAKPQTLRPPKQHAGRDEELCVSLSVQNFNSMDPNRSLESILQRIGETLGASLQKCEHGMPLKPFHWRAIYRDDGAWAGNITIMCRSATDIQSLVHRIHGCGIVSAGVCSVIEVVNMPPSLVAACSQVSRPGNSFQGSSQPTG